MNGGGIIAANGKRRKKAQRKISFRTAEVRELGRSLAALGLVRIRKGEALNVRRRENLRRTLAEAGQPLRWAEVAALSENPVDVAAGDVKKMVKSGARSIGQSVLDELAEKRAEVNRLKKLVTELRKLAKDKKVEYPTEITYSRTVRSGGDEFVVRTEVLTLNDAEEVNKAADKIEKSLPTSAKVRDEVVADLKRKQDSLKDLTGNVTDLVESWRGVLREVLVTMR